MKLMLAERGTDEDFYVLNFGYEYESENARWNKGLRNMYVMHYVLSGEGYYNSARVKSGEGFFIRPGEKCEYHTSKDSPWKYFWIAFGGKEGGNIAKKYVAPNTSGIFEFNLSKEFFALIDELFSEEAPLGARLALGYFYFFISYNGKEKIAYKNAYVEDAKKYMSLNFSRSISITELASEVGVNDRYLYNLFIKHEGTSPKRYLSELRLSRAALLLKSTKLSISEIAELCGFQDVLAFSRFFSKNRDVSPTKFRSEG
jgi:AraC-like DNA-binding protein